MLVIAIFILCNIGGFIRLHYSCHMSLKWSLISIISIDLLALISYFIE